MEAEAARLWRKDMVDKFMDTGDGGWELCQKIIGDFEDFSLFVVDCLRYRIWE